MRARRLAIAGLTLLGACSKGLSGTYRDDSGMFSFDFSPNGKVQMSTNVLGMKSTVEMPYVVEGKKVKIGPDGEVQVFALNDKGCLEGSGFMGTLCHVNH